MGSSTNKETEYVTSWVSKDTSLQATFDILKLGIFNQYQMNTLSLYSFKLSSVNISKYLVFVMSWLSYVYATTYKHNDLIYVTFNKRNLGFVLNVYHNNYSQLRARLWVILSIYPFWMICTIIFQLKHVKPVWSWLYKLEGKIYVFSIAWHNTRCRWDGTFCYIAKKTLWCITGN